MSQIHCFLSSVVLVALSTSPLPAQVRLGPNGPFIESKPAAKKSRSTSKRPVENPNEPKTFQLTISPAAEPDLPLKYSLLPSYENVKPGNSVPFYLRAILSSKSRSKREIRKFHDNMSRWMDGPPSKMPRGEVREYLRTVENVFRELKVATHREKTDWSWRLQDLDGLKAIGFLLPEIQEARELSRLLALRIRLAIAEGRHEDAIESFQMGYKLARDVAEPPTLINDLVGVAIASILDHELIRLIGSPDSPNMYWALSKLPRPFIDMQPALQYEMMLPAKLFPALKNAETAHHTPAEWGQILTNAFQKLDSLDPLLGGSSQRRFLMRTGMTALVLKGYPTAKRDLIAWGYNAKRVEAMPVGQVVAIHQARIYRYMYQQMMKWSHLPPHQAVAGARREEEKLKREGYLGPAGRTREILPVASLLLPAVAQAHSATARLDSRTAGLQVLEAIRMHAANHGGELPETLNDIKAVPIPKNPLTDQPYPYRRRDRGRAVLTIPAPSNQSANIGWRFELTVRKAK